ncbi:related to C2H2 finger domain protein (Gli3) [Cephalotrichum gorgonifer]|uniref:Related to C2H2 finger domain protein (Gli3) n=1 Tax=Cephalotrichum gorgonifer TaxID=2041049 RepID=A0AAE8MNP8_9PEZI|nr:related to C2H2 finger domain protein (Gli3) [Cephalotrichum gorgonifer]
MAPKRSQGRKSSPHEDEYPDSPLSSVDSSEPPSDDEAADDADETESRPSKRQKFTPGATPATVAAPEAEADEPPELDGMSDVSEDTDGDVPNSPANARYEEEDFQEQVSACAWDGCDAGDMANMDNLVEHIHNEHIESRQKKYTCEWIGCSRKSMAHASGYALKAHMRSHTREKPFYCYLPECDRAFTRSDALAKHMRTVHETEALRPSDPVPKSHQGAGPSSKSSKLKIIIKTPQSHATGQDDSVDEGGDGNDSEKEHFTPLSEDQFTEKELGYSLQELHKRCRIQVRLSENENERLMAEIKELSEAYKEEWLEKESLLSQVIQSEMDWHERRAAVASGAVNIKLTAPVGAGADEKAKVNGHANGDALAAAE